MKKEKMRKRQEQAEEEREKQKESRKEQIKQMAAQYLTKDAKQRLGNVRAANPDLASSIEMQIVKLGRSGRVDRIDDSKLKDILKSLQKEKDDSSSDIKFRR
ncbi:MAG: DNA-binding protein [Candidatus Nanohaloarchaea archaeon]